VANSKRKTQTSWLPQTILLGIVMLVVYELLQGRVPQILLIIGVLTISIAWAVGSTFRGQWANRKFWLVVGLLFTLHLGLMWAVVSRMTRFDLSVVWLIVIPEALTVFIVLRWLFGDNLESKK